MIHLFPFKFNRSIRNSAEKGEREEGGGGRGKVSEGGKWEGGRGEECERLKAVVGEGKIKKGYLGGVGSSCKYFSRDRGSGINKFSIDK